MKIETNNTRLTLEGTESREFPVVEWSPGHVAVETTRREIWVWSEGRYQTPTVLNAVTK